MIKSVLVREWQLPDHGEPPRHGGAPERGDAVPHPLLLHLQLGVTCRVAVGPVSIKYYFGPSYPYFIYFIVA